MITCIRGTGEDHHLFTIGCEYTSHVGGKKFTSLRDCNGAEEAMAWISYLNGGNHPDLTLERREKTMKAKV
jgi:hypothetical protein